jgi:hypothetical protein
MYGKRARQPTYRVDFFFDTAAPVDDKQETMADAFVPIGRHHTHNQKPSPPLPVCRLPDSIHSYHFALPGGSGTITVLLLVENDDCLQSTDTDGAVQSCLFMLSAKNISNCQHDRCRCS